MRHENRSRVRLLTLLLFSLVASSPFNCGADELSDAELKVMDTLVQSYGATDWSAVVAGIAANPMDGANANIMVIPLSLGNAYLNRYEANGDVADLERA